jgi:hypothetical protein
MRPDFFENLASTGRLLNIPGPCTYTFQFSFSFARLDHRQSMPSSQPLHIKQSKDKSDWNYKQTDENTKTTGPRTITKTTLLRMRPHPLRMTGITEEFCLSIPPRIDRTRSMLRQGLAIFTIRLVDLYSRERPKNPGYGCCNQGYCSIISEIKDKSGKYSQYPNHNNK